MDNLQTILNSKSRDEPPQLKALKKYMQENYNFTAVVAVSKTHYSLEVPNAGLAGLIRLETQKIIDACDLDKKLVILIRH